MSTSRLLEAHFSKNNDAIIEDKKLKNSLVCINDDDIGTWCQLNTTNNVGIYTFFQKDVPLLLPREYRTHVIVNAIIDKCGGLIPPKALNSSDDFLERDCDYSTNHHCARPLPSINSLFIFREKGMKPNRTLEKCMFITAQDIFNTYTKSEYTQIAIPNLISLLLLTCTLLFYCYDRIRTNKKEYTKHMQDYIDSFQGKNLFSTALKSIDDRDIPANFRDPITNEIMDCPILVNGSVQDLKNLVKLEKDRHGLRIDKVTGFPFTLKELQPALDIKNEIEEKIGAIATRRIQHA